MSQVVGRNVRAVRERLEWSQAEMSMHLSPYGLKVSRTTVAQLENGKRPISVDDLHSLARCLGVAPHVLMYPPPDSAVVCGDYMTAAPNLARWLWDPESSALTSAPSTYERKSYLDALELYDMPPEDAEKVLTQPAIPEGSADWRRGDWEAHRRRLRYARMWAKEHPDAEDIPEDPNGRRLIQRCDIDGVTAEDIRSRPGSEETS
jgi:transcriptional regulator with XRE-family HTH domain